MQDSAWLKEIREDDSLRSNYRRNGVKGTGPFTADARRTILVELLRVEAAFGETLVSDEELRLIQEIWTEEFDVRNSAMRLALKYGRTPRRTCNQ